LRSDRAEPDLRSVAGHRDGGGFADSGGVDDESDFDERRGTVCADPCDRFDYPLENRSGLIQPNWASIQSEKRIGKSSADLENSFLIKEDRNCEKKEKGEVKPPVLKGLTF